MAQEKRAISTMGLQVNLKEAAPHARLPVRVAVVMFTSFLSICFGYRLISCHQLAGLGLASSETPEVLRAT